MAIGLKLHNNSHVVSMQVAQQEINYLQAELAHKNQILLEKLHSKINLTYKIRQNIHHENLQTNLPNWLYDYLQENAFVNNVQWARFKDEFNSIYDNYLTKLTDKYPAITQADLQYIALSALGLSINDITMLLDCSTAGVVSNRKIRIKKHLNIQSDLDSWIQSDLIESTPVLQKLKEQNMLNLPFSK